jgi:hypothetical protein
MVKVEILIPERSNEGELFTPGDHSAFEAQLLSLFGGFSRLPGLVKGAWRSDDGQTYHDDLIVYVVFVSAVLTESAKILAAVNFAKANYGQLAVSVTYLGQAEII